jgi:hypothetical protein
MEVPSLEQFNELAKLVYSLQQEVASLRAQQPEWVSEPEAQRCLLIILAGPWGADDWPTFLPP